MTETQISISPHNQKPYLTRTYPTKDELDILIQNGAKAQKIWKDVPLEERTLIGWKFIAEFKKEKDEIPYELTLQMGRPISQCAGEIRGVVERSEYMLSIASQSLADISFQHTDPPGFRRYIKHTPLGVILVIAPWNYPYLVCINVVLPAIVAGNAVVLKPSPQTPKTAERLAGALIRAGVPSDVIQVVHMSPLLVNHAIKNPIIDFVSFTGSVSGGHSVAKAAAEGFTFTGVGLELGGKDPAYVRHDADLEYTVPEIAEGVFYNAGQSCCAVERIYVHESLYDEFIERFVKIAKSYKLGDPTLPETNLGPVVNLASARRIRKQVEDAVKSGAIQLISEDLFPIAKIDSTYVAPQVLINVDHSMDIMKEETFGPVVGIQKVSSDAEAIGLMNDSPYGLTASVWTNVRNNVDSEKDFLNIVDELVTGTVFLNRCDHCDPALPWSGVKNSGRGISLSKFGYEQLSKTKSVHMRIQTP